jgi:hypothetical protein
LEESSVFVFEIEGKTILNENYSGKLKEKTIELKGTN